MTKYTWTTKLSNVTYDSDTKEYDWTDEELTDAVSIYKHEELLLSRPVLALIKRDNFYEFTTTTAKTLPAQQKQKQNKTKK